MLMDATLHFGDARPDERMEIRASDLRVQTFDIANLISDRVLGPTSPSGDADHIDDFWITLN